MSNLLLISLIYLSVISSIIILYNSFYLLLPLTLILIILSSFFLLKSNIKDNFKIKKIIRLSLKNFNIILTIIFRNFYYVFEQISFKSYENQLKEIEIDLETDDDFINKFILFLFNFDVCVKNGYLTKRHMVIKRKDDKFLKSYQNYYNRIIKNL